VDTPIGITRGPCARLEQRPSRKAYFPGCDDGFGIPAWSRRTRGHQATGTVTQLPSEMCSSRRPAGRPPVTSLLQWVRGAARSPALPSSGWAFAGTLEPLEPSFAISLYETTHFHELGNSRKRFQRFHRSISGRLMRNVAHRAPAPERVDQLEQGSGLLPDRPTPLNRAVAILWAPQDQAKSRALTT